MPGILSTHRGRPAILGVLAWVHLVVAVGAQDPLQALLPPKDSLPRPKLLVLTTGRVIEGEIEAQLGGYMVRSRGGTMVIQYGQVRTAAESLHDAYERLAKNHRNPTANERIDLAQWCLQVGLVEEARTELLAALRLEPQRVEARRLLIDVEAHRASRDDRPAESFDAGPTLGTGAPSTSIANLSRDRVADYMRQIQPLLLNSCGNAKCHSGAGAGRFRLRPTARSNRADSEANLVEVLRFIDMADPEASPLLTLPRTGEGVHASAFRGIKSEEQYERLAIWARLVAHESRTVRPRPYGGAVEDRKIAEWDHGAVVPAAAFVESESESADAKTGASVDDRFAQRIVGEEAPDPFDPDEFNRRVHGLEATRR